MACFIYPLTVFPAFSADFYDKALNFEDYIEPKGTSEFSEKYFGFGARNSYIFI